MNKYVKVFLSVIGAIDVVFSFFTPIAVALILTITFDFTSFQEIMLIVFASISSVYRAIKVGILKLLD